MSGLRTVLAAAAVALLCSCQTIGDAYDDLFGNPKAKIPDLVPIKQTATLTVLWQAAVGASGSGVFFPVVDLDVVYVAGRDGRISGIEASTGNVVKQFSSEEPLGAGVGVGDGLVLVATEQSELTAFSVQGKRLWKVRVLGEVLAPPATAQGVVVVRAGNNQIYGLNAADGKQRWLYQRTPPPLSVRAFAGVVVYRGAVFAGFAGGRLVALTLSSGTVGWESVVALPRGTTELERVADVTSAPAVDDSRVCAVAFQGRAACFDLVRGSQIWGRDVSSIAGLAIGARNVYVTDDKSAVLALDKASGASIWRQDKLAGRQLSGPLVVGNHVVLGDIEGYVHVMSRETGALEARLTTDGSAINAAPVAIGPSRFVVQTSNGGIYAMSIQ